MRASLHTIGCRLNQSETALLGDALRRRGYDIVPYGQPTDLLVLNTCAVTDNAERECRYEVRKTLRHSPHAFVAITGCYAQAAGPALGSIPGIDLIVGTSYKMTLPECVPSPTALRKHPAPELLHSRTIDREDFTLPGVGEHDSTRANLKIQDGCNVMCSFCIIPFTRGHERSRRLDDVQREAEALAAKGHREVILTGVNVGQYRQGAATLVDLIQRLDGVHGLDRIRISSIEPTTLTDELLACFGSSRKLCRHLHIPLQSGDDGVLRAMNRPYTTQTYAGLLDRIARLIPDVAIGTDVMVGFPTEGEREFAATCSFLRGLPLAYCHVFSFSRRPGTAAARMAQSVPVSTIHRRSRLVAEQSRMARLAFYQRFTGAVVSVLFESQDAAGQWVGLTDNYLRVGVASEEPLANQLRPVQITGVMDGYAVGRVVADGR